jgi:cell division protein FtsB
MRWLTLILVALIAALQYPLWLGKGSWLRVWEVDRQAAQQKEVNQKLRARNASLDAEVRDLKQGYGAIEERARSELGMVKRDEVFFQVLQDPKKPGHAAVDEAKKPDEKATPSTE